MYQIPRQVSAGELQEQQRLSQERELLTQRLEVAREAQRILRDGAKQLDPLFQLVPGQHYITDLSSDYQVLRKWRRIEEVKLPLEPVWEAWHGTSVDVIEQVSSQGLRARASKRRHLFGRGLYFTRDLRKALGHALKHGKKIAVLLRCRVAMGKIAADDSVRFFRRMGGASHFGLGPRYEYNSLYCGAGAAVEHAWGGNVVNEEFVVFDERQAVVEEIYLIQPRVQAQLEPAKQRQGQRSRFENSRAKKTRASDREHIARHHYCVKNGEVCCWASVERARTQPLAAINTGGRKVSTRSRLPDLWLSLCARHGRREVVAFPLHTIEEQKRFCTALCPLWVPHSK